MPVVFLLVACAKMYRQIWDFCLLEFEGAPSAGSSLLLHPRPRQVTSTYSFAQWRDPLVPEGVATPQLIESEATPNKNRF